MHVMMLTNIPTTNIAANWKRLVSPVFGEDDIKESFYIRVLYPRWPLYE